MKRRNLDQLRDHPREYARPLDNSGDITLVLAPNRERLLLLDINVFGPRNQFNVRGF